MWCALYGYTGEYHEAPGMPGYAVNQTPRVGVDPMSSRLNR